MEATFKQAVASTIKTAARQCRQFTGGAHASSSCPSPRRTTGSGVRRSHAATPNRRGQNAGRGLARRDAGRQRRPLATKAASAPPTFVELNAGVGGFHLALKANGLQCAYVHENRPAFADAHELNHKLPLDRRDIKDLSEAPGELPDCTVLAMSGQPHNSPDPRWGYEGGFAYQMKIVAAKLPPIVLTESPAPGAQNAALPRNESKRVKFTGAFERLGYHLSDQIYNSSNFGLPLNHKQAYFVAVHKTASDSPFVFPKQPKNNTARLRDILVRDVHPLAAQSERGVTFNEQNGILVTVRSRSKTPLMLHWKSLDEIPPPASSYVIPNERRIVGYFKSNNDANDRGIVRTRAVIYSDLGHAVPLLPVYGMSGWYLTPDTMEEGRAPVPVVRRLFAEEMRALQGFPDGFQHPTKPQVAVALFGDAVTVPVVEFIVKAVKDQYPELFGMGKPGVADDGRLAWVAGGHGREHVRWAFDQILESRAGERGPEYKIKWAPSSLWEPTWELKTNITSIGLLDDKREPEGDGRIAWTDGHGREHVRWAFDKILQTRLGERGLEYKIRWAPSSLWEPTWELKTDFTSIGLQVTREASAEASEIVY